MNFTLHYILGLMAFLVHISVFAQDMNECRKKIEAFNKKINNIQVPSIGSTYHFKYTAIIEFNDSRKPVEQNVDIIMSKHQVHYKTDKIEMYQDTTMGFMVDHHSGTIFTFPYIPGIDQEKRLNKIVMVRDSVFDVFNIVSCNEVSNASGTLHKMVFEPDILLKKNLNIDRIIYYYNVKTGLAEQFIMEFEPDYEYKRRTIIYKTMNLDYKKKLNTPVRNLLMTDEGDLKPEYKKYQLIIKN